MAINYIWSNATNKNGDTNWRGSTFRIKKDIRITEILVLSDFPTNISNLELWETDNSGKFSLKIHGGVPSARTGEAYLTCETTLLKDKNYTIVFKQSVSAVGNFYSIVSGVSTVSDSFEALSTIGSSNFNYSNPTTAPSVGVSASGNSIEVQVGFKEKEPLNKILILSNNKTYGLMKGDYAPNDIVPKMTGDNLPSPFSIKASNVNGTGYAWQAFDDSYTTSWIATGSTGWLSISLGIKYKVGKYSLSSIGTQAPKDWTFEGSNDGTNWTVLDTRTNVTGWVTATKREFTFNPEAFSNYRINITANNGTSYTRIEEMELFEQMEDKLQLLPSQSEQNFIAHGMDKSTEIDLNSQMTNKVFIEQSSTPLGSGKVFKKTIDTSTTPIKKVEVK